MQGQDVFRWAVTADAPGGSGGAGGRRAHRGPVDVFVPHQANLRIIDALVKKLALPEHVSWRGTSSTPATLPRLGPPLAGAYARIGTGPQRGSALLIGFGAGLTYAARSSA